MSSRSLMAANWKMYKTVEQSLAYARELVRRLDEEPVFDVEQLVCPTMPALYPLVQRLAGTSVKVGAQTLDLGQEGANTGAVSGYLVREAGAEYVIVGHSERRQLYGEGDTLVRDKAVAAVQARLTPILCVGETRDQRQAGQTDAVIVRQVEPVIEALVSDADLVIAYEPLWAIGTGVLPEPKEANRVAEIIRQVVDRMRPNFSRQVRILYGGSVNRDNIRDFAAQPGLDGALVGGASLDVGHWLELNRFWREVRA